ncbi:MAG TPA: hypothetical protein VK921_15405 [Anditalea sp.]|nr:hypothetical protein [Anditalea sp.]
MPKARHTFLLMIILVTPFIIKSLFGYQFEMYPAIILPSGPHLITLEGNTFNHKQIELYVQEEGEPWVQLNTVEVLNPLPEQYSSPILRREFGLSPPRTYPDRKFLKIMKSLHMLDPRILDESEINELKLWIKYKIMKWGISADKVKLETVEKTIDLQGNIIKKLVESEQIIHLD